MKRDPVTSELHAAVLTRDRACILWKLDPRHECRDSWGTPHRPDDLAKLSIEHVKSELRMGRRAPSDLAHCVALCAGANIAVPSKAKRQAIREYLARVSRFCGAVEPGPITVGVAHICFALPGHHGDHEW